MKAFKDRIHAKDMLKCRRGSVPWKKIDYSVFVLVALFVLWYFFIRDCTITQEELVKAKTNSLAELTVWVKDNIFLCGIEAEAERGVLGKTLAFVKGVLGFNASFYDFVPYLLTGLFVGLWIWLAYWLAGISIFASMPLVEKRESEREKLRSSWLYFIGSHFWKILPIAAFYAVLTQIPLVNRFIQIITFEVFGVNWFVRSILIAFYIGIIPSAIEAYTRHRLRRYYYNQILRAKYGTKIAKAMADG